MGEIFWNYSTSDSVSSQGGWDGTSPSASHPTIGDAQAQVTGRQGGSLLGNPQDFPDNCLCHTDG